jgi:hypothetical protein
MLGAQTRRAVPKNGHSPSCINAINLIFTTRHCRLTGINNELELLYPPISVGATVGVSLDSVGSGAGVSVAGSGVSLAGTGVSVGGSEVGVGVTGVSVGSGEV